MVARGRSHFALVPRVEDCEARLLSGSTGGRVFVGRAPRARLGSGSNAIAPCGGDNRAQTQAGGRNVIVFVADGLRPGSVNSANAPTLNALRKLGVILHDVTTKAILPAFSSSSRPLPWSSGRANPTALSTTRGTV